MTRFWNHIMLALGVGLFVFIIVVAFQLDDALGPADMPPQPTTIPPSTTVGVSLIPPATTVP